jgi:UDP-glucose 4-epimerase
VVRANALALEHDLLGAYNVGTGVETSVNTLYDTMQRVLGRDIDAVRAPGRPGEQQRSCLDAAKIQQQTGWRPATTLADGLGKTLAYFAARRSRA